MTGHRKQLSKSANDTKLGQTTPFDEDTTALLEDLPTFLEYAKNSKENFIKCEICGLHTNKVKVFKQL